MSSFKKLSKSDVTVVPYHANKQWSFPSASVSPYFSIYKGINATGSFSLTNDAKTAGQYERLIFSEINQKFYQQYTSSLNTSSLANSIYYESASQQRATSSHFIFNDNDRFVNYFPTGSMQGIQVMTINQDIYGSKVLPNSFVISASSYYITDDGYGNLYNAQNTSHVGSIFYAQGLAIITNQNSQSIFTVPFSSSFKNEHTIYENEIRCLVKESDFNLSYNPTLLISGSQYIVSGSNGYILTGSTDNTIKNFATGSNFYTYATALGLYNDNNELLAVAKFGKPMLMSPDTDMTFVVKYDI
jgi:hypothetical protein